VGRFTRIFYAVLGLLVLLIVAHIGLSFLRGRGLPVVSRVAGVVEDAAGIAS